VTRHANGRFHVTQLVVFTPRKWSVSRHANGRFHATQVVGFTSHKWSVSRHASGRFHVTQMVVFTSRKWSFSRHANGRFHVTQMVAFTSRKWSLSRHANATFLRDAKRSILRHKERIFAKGTILRDEPFTAMQQIFHCGRARPVAHGGRPRLLAFTAGHAAVWRICHASARRLFQRK